MTIERLGRLTRVNRVPVFLISAAVVLVGLFAPGWLGASVLLLVAAVLLALVAVTVRVTPRPLVAARLVILAGLLAVAVYKIMQ